MDENYNWIRVMEKGLNMIFYICAKPSLIIRSIAHKIFCLTKHQLALFIVEDQKFFDISRLSLK